MKSGDRVRMTEAAKAAMRARGDGAHVDEFGSAVGVVGGPMFPDQPGTAEVDVRWFVPHAPQGLRYSGYNPSELEPAVKSAEQKAREFDRAWHVGVEGREALTAMLDEHEAEVRADERAKALAVLGEYRTGVAALDQFTAWATPEVVEDIDKLMAQIAGSGS